MFMQIKGFIYCYTNVLNNKKYIGQTTKTLRERAGKNGTGYSNKFGNAIKKYGWENFKSEVLEECSAELKEDLIKVLNERESYWISFYNSIEEGYNITKGGDASCGWTQEMKDKLSKTNKGHIVSQETRRKISEANKGHKPAIISDEIRLKLSEAGKKSAEMRKGKHYYNNGKEEGLFLDNEVPEGWVKGRKPVSAETRKKLSEARKGKPSWAKGTKWTEQHRLHIQETWEKKKQKI